MIETIYMKHQYVKPIIILISLFIFCSCKENTIESKNITPLKDKLPENAVKIEDDLYYIPIGRDEDNCLMYRAYSEKNAVLAAIIYRNKNKTFSLSKNKETCL